MEISKKDEDIIKARNEIKEEFTFYLSSVAKSSRRTEKGFNLQLSAVQSFLSFIEVDKLFDYNPEAWKHIKSMYDITNPDEVSKIVDKLFNDEAFEKHDSEKNQSWRSGSIMHYSCFITARTYFLNRANNQSFKNAEAKPTTSYTDSPFQQIFYGAPGTGKSYTSTRLRLMKM